MTQVRKAFFNQNVVAELQCRFSPVNGYYLYLNLFFSFVQTRSIAVLFPRLVRSDLGVCFRMTLYPHFRFELGMNTYITTLLKQR